MAGTRQDGILLTDDIGGSGGPGVAVDISSPIGQKDSTESVSVVMASDMMPFQVDVADTVITDIVAPMGSKPEAESISVVIASDQTPIEVKITDGVDIVDVVPITDSTGATVNGLVTNSLIYGESTAGGGSYEKVKVNPSGAIQIDGDVEVATGIDALNTGLAADNPWFPAAGILGSDWGLFTLANTEPTSIDNGLVVRQVGLPAAAALADNTANPTLTKINSYPMMFDGTNWDRLKGDATDGLLVNLGTNNDVRITDGTDVATVGANNELDLAPRALVVGGLDNPQSRIYAIPVIANNFTLPNTNYQAVIAELRGPTSVDQSTTMRDEFLKTGGIGYNASGTPRNQRFVFTDGNTLAINPANTYGLQTRECGHSFANNGSISTVGQRFTVSSRYVVRTAALFKLVSSSFSGTVRPVVSLDNGTNWSYCEAVNIETGVAASSYVDGAVTGTYAIPFGNGATDYGFEVTARAGGSVNCFVSANSNGVNSVYTLARDITFGNDSIDVSGSTVTATVARSSTCTQTQVPDSATSVTILAANAGRFGATILNTSTVTLYLRLSSSAATTSNYSVALVAGSYYEVPYNYTGEITGIWASDPGTGNANVSEFTV